MLIQFRSERRRTLAFRSRRWRGVESPGSSTGLTGTCRSGTRCGSLGPARRRRSCSPRSSRIRSCRRPRCSGRKQVSGTRTSRTSARPCCTGSATYRPGRLQCLSPDRSIRCRELRRCSSLGILPSPACRRGPGDSRQRLCTSNSRPACRCDPACTSRKGRRHCRNHSSRFRAGSCRLRRSTRCKELRRCSSAGTRRWSYCTLVRSGNRWPRRTPLRRFHSPSGHLQSRIHRRRRNRHQCPLRRRRRSSHSRKLRCSPPPLRRS
jgi:hypothetical protein